MSKQSAFDPGLAAVLAVLLAIGAAIVYVAALALSSEPATPVGEGAGERPAVRQPVPEPPRGLVRRGAREKLEREIERAKRELEQARVQRAADPLGGWNEIAEAAERELARLREELQRLGQ